ncbi:MAG: queuosine precursor transporter [Acidobacteria bacterium]|nr:queuosine precursor transporter [Acidobacteriota bacterium]
MVAPKSFERFKYYDLLVSAFVAVLLVSNIVAPKLVAVGPFLFSGALLLFPVTYIFGDIFTEVYGYAGSRRAIWNGFLASVLLAVLSAILVALPPAPTFKDQQAFETVLGSTPRAVAASLIAFWAGEFANSFVLAKMKLLTSGRYLWVRTIGSTVVGQAADTALVVTIIFLWKRPASEIVQLIASGYIGKVLYEAAATPLTYLVVNFLKRREGIDVLDEGTDFNPFHIEGGGLR